MRCSIHRLAIAVASLTMLLTACHRAEMSKPLIVIIVPSQDNPFFKSEGDAAAAEKAWTKLLSLEKQTSLAAQAHFGLAGLYRKQGKTAQAQHEMQEFQKLQNAIGPPRSE